MTWMVTTRGGWSSSTASFPVSVHCPRGSPVISESSAKKSGRPWWQRHWRYGQTRNAGLRSGTVSQAVKTSGLPRSLISNPNLYYYASDLYPSFIGLREAAGVMGIAESAAHRLIRAGQFPFPAARAGRSYKVSVRALMHFKDIPDAIVHVDDIENGALHASGGVR